MNLSGLVIIITTTLFPAYQLFGLANISDQLALFSQYLGLSALILMAWGQILATRLPGIEVLFGGLDRIYVLHKWTGIVAMVAVLFHDTIDADMKGIAQKSALADFGETLGEISLYGLLILVIISLITFIPYHLWKWTHKAMGALFAAGCVHFFLIMKPFNMSDPAGYYTGFFCAAGMLAYLWTLLPDRFRPSHDYEISELKETGGALAITIVPEKKGLKPAPGQFGILQFTGGGNSEPHPFSFSKISENGSLRVTVKALGDFTSSLPKSLDVGQKVCVQGPFGRFRLTTSKSQIWIAGGIGITPFLTWAEALNSDNQTTIDFFYCVRSRDQAPHLAEIERLAKSKQNFNLHLFDSSDKKRLTAEQIAELSQSALVDTKVFFCGPKSLRDTLQMELQKYGLNRRRFHYEEFEFRTGIGLRKLAGWLLKRGFSTITRSQKT